MVLFMAAGCALLPGRSEDSGYLAPPPSEAPASAATDLEKAENSSSRWGLFRRGGGDRSEAADERSAETKEATVAAQPASAEDEDDPVPATTPYRLRTGDALRVTVSSIPRELSIENVIDEHGMVTLDYLGKLRAEGLTASELESRIRRAYIDGQIYRAPTVKVLISARNYYVRGEVRRPGTFPLTGVVTLSQAIAAAGGYTEFANPRKVTLNRGSQNIAINMRDVERRPDLDEILEANDLIVVGRGIW